MASRRQPRRGARRHPGAGPARPAGRGALPGRPGEGRRRGEARQAPPFPPRGARAAGVDLDAVVDRTLRLNGRSGELQLARGEDKALRIVKYVLLGEVVSNPEQQCRIDIVADQPIEARPQGEPDGLPRYASDVPACPLTFDVVGDGVLVPAQTNACVFSVGRLPGEPQRPLGAGRRRARQGPQGDLESRAPPPTARSRTACARSRGATRTPPPRSRANRAISPPSATTSAATTPPRRGSASAPRGSLRRGRRCSPSE